MSYNILSTPSGVKLAQAGGVPITVHAGEWPRDRYDTLGNIHYALEHLGASRIGHGLALQGQSCAMNLAKSMGTTVEVRGGL
jgi:adenosine deaminase